MRTVFAVPFWLLPVWWFILAVVGLLALAYVCVVALLSLIVALATLVAQAIAPSHRPST